MDVLIVSVDSLFSGAICYRYMPLNIIQMNVKYALTNSNIVSLSQYDPDCLVLGHVTFYF